MANENFVTNKIEPVKTEAPKLDVKTEVKQEVIKKLWCPRCQRGPSGHPDFEKLQSGDACPFCVELNANGHIGSDVIAKLWDGDSWWKEMQRRADMQRELSTSQVKHIETGADAKVRDLQKQVDDMKKLIEQLQPKK